VIFAHGAGEVGYMAGPLATIWFAVKVRAKLVSATANGTAHVSWDVAEPDLPDLVAFAAQDGVLYSKVSAPIWCIIVSALGLVIGLGTYGYNVTRAMGTRMAKLSPTRGFSAELSTALVIMIAAQYGLPTSSSQCITGGIIGVGLLEGKAGEPERTLCAQLSLL
jgi:sodium-dependent phosphate transporter